MLSALAPDDVLEWVTLVALLTDSLAAAVEEDEGDAESNEEGKEAVDDVDGEMSRAKPSSTKMSGIDTGEGRLGAPLPVHVAGDASVVLSYRVCNTRIADNP